MLLIHFYKINLFKTVFQEHHQSVKLFGFSLKYCLCVRNMKNIWHEVLFEYFHKKKLILLPQKIDKGADLSGEQSQI